MPGHGEKLTRLREQALAALLSEPTIEAAAVKAKVSYRTLRRWLTEPGFAATYRQVRRQTVEAALGRLQQVTIFAVATLQKNLTADRPADQIRSALGILEHAVKAVEVADLLALVEDLQRQLDGVKHVRNGQATGPVLAAGAGATDGNGDAAARADPGGPEPDSDAGGQVPRRLADDAPPPLF
jgi:hypothetical protein